MMKLCLNNFGFKKRGKDRKNSFYTLNALTFHLIDMTSAWILLAIIGPFYVNRTPSKSSSKGGQDDIVALLQLIFVFK